MSYGRDFSQMAGHESLHKFNIQQAHWHSDQISQFLDSLAVFPNQWTAFIDIKQARPPLSGSSDITEFLGEILRRL